MTTKHTREPWCFYLSPVGLPGSDWSLYQDMDTGTGEPDAAGHIGEVFGQSVAENNANALRIVSCVNACAGMADPARELAALRSQRDELRRAVKHILDSEDDSLGDGGSILGEDLRSIALAALARCGKEGK